MQLRRFAVAISAVAVGVAGVHAQAPAATGYLLPPKVIVDILDAPPTPAVIVSPERHTIALLERRSMPTIAQLAEPIYRVAGARINPRTNGRQQRTGAVTGITLQAIDASASRAVVVPPGANIANVSFSPDGHRLAFTNTTAKGIQLWIADVATGASHLVSGTDRLNATAGDPCDWLEGSTTIVCTIVPPGRGPAPAERRVPFGPNIQETTGKPSPAATYEDLIKTRFDEDVFHYYFTSQLVAYGAATPKRTPLGSAGVIEAVTASPDGRYLLVTRVKRPYSHLLPMNGFPKDVEVWTAGGKVVRRVADLPSSEGVVIAGVPTGPRQFRWRVDQPATLTWAEALDDGNPRKEVPFRDRILSLQAPFSGEPMEIAKTAWRFAGLQYTTKGAGFLSESDRRTRHVRTWLLEPGAPPRTLWDRRQDDAYGNPGTPVTRRGVGGGRGAGSDSPILQSGSFVYLTGAGATPEGDRPFLDRLNLATGRTERLFRADAKTYEAVIAPLDEQATRILTRYETPNDPPNYYVRDLGTGEKRAVTTFPDPAPQLRGVTKQLITYQRKDGVKLDGTLYLPPGYKQGERLPLIMWAYPREFGDPDSASQVTGSPYRFTTYGGASQLFLLTQGYAVLDDPSMPIIGPGETANDTYVDQLVADAQAAVDKVVEMGVADRDRIGVGGHSYGAFMTANLLAHTNLFRAGVARSGAYNRTLTPFGFQNERRTFWDVPDIYEKMSPFFYANKIQTPILLIHGEADDNSGTFPIQSERFYMALKGFGATVRYVTLPYEAHGYAGRESVLHTLAEMVNWFDTYVKHATPRPGAVPQR